MARIELKDLPVTEQEVTPEWARAVKGGFFYSSYRSRLSYDIYEDSGGPYVSPLQGFESIAVRM